MIKPYDAHVDEFAELFQSENHRAFFAVRDAPTAEGTKIYLASGFDDTRLSDTQNTLLQLVMLSRYAGRLSTIMETDPRYLLKLGIYWDNEAGDDIESFLEETPKLLEEESSDFKIDEPLE